MSVSPDARSVGGGAVVLRPVMWAEHKNLDACKNDAQNSNTHFEFD